jgi:AraC-like DNA-binding protein
LAFKLSPHQYIINKRLEFAKEQLLTTGDTFNEITYASGFECPSSFGRLFKERFGVTPIAMRSISAADYFAVRKDFQGVLKHQM